MRLLVACPSCHRQYDASGRPLGTKFHCSCGMVLEVQKPKAHNASVVRCSACGAPREGESLACAYCAATFTLQERDLNTVCPECLARVSDQAKFCHHCATPIVPEDDASSESEHSCPVCGEEKRLSSRRLGEARLSVLECGVCVGLWLSIDSFERLEAQATDRSAAKDGPSAKGAGSKPVPAQQGPLYRPCVVCKKLMNRQNYGKRSGVIIDSCKEHGVWFDDQELERILAWIRGGGLAQSHERDAMEAKEIQRQAAASKDLGGNWAADAEVFRRRAYDRGDLLWDLGQFIGGLFSR